VFVLNTNSGGGHMQVLSIIANSAGILLGAFFGAYLYKKLCRKSLEKSMKKEKMQLTLKLTKERPYLSLFMWISGIFFGVSIVNDLGNKLAYFKTPIIEKYIFAIVLGIALHFIIFRPLSKKNLN